MAAQIGAETRSRLRSPSTIVTVLALFAAAFVYVPAPDAKRASIMWEVGGHMYSGTYTAGFIGAVVALLTSMLLPLVGFYLVAGSVRRDLERRVWPIIAATRTSATSYLLGKWVASFAYLLVLAALALLPATYLFLRYGTGPFALGQLLMPWLLLAPAAMAFTAACALLFDVTPGLSGRGGYVLWFFVFSFLFMMIPAGISGRFDKDPTNDRSTTYDPAGLVFFHDLIARSVAQPVHSLSLGVIILDEPVRRLPFAPLRVDGGLLARRAATFAWTALPLLAAIGIFKLAAGRGARAPRRRGSRRRGAPATPPMDWRAASGGPAEAFRPHSATPSFARAVLAEGVLLWQSASWIKWPMLAAAGASLFVPGSGAAAPMAIFLLLLAPVIGEAAAREQLAGTGATVYAQPGLPPSRVMWKLAAIAGFVALAGSPVLLRSLLRGAGFGLAMLLGLAFTAMAAAGLGWLTGGGKLFLGLYTALWYVAIQRDSPLDFVGAFGAQPRLSVCAAFAAAGAAAVVLAAAVEKARAARG
ncbi:MAG TPA: hypothetical protein VGS57_02740 [Thermoanaerobaculia bacterium]|jgi:hypothetical protein|nr:hypothetical protein [Thermoanaerobaculia bacterium]